MLYVVSLLSIYINIMRNVLETVFAITYNHSAQSVNSITKSILSTFLLHEKQKLYFSDIEHVFMNLQDHFF